MRCRLSIAALLLVVTAAAGGCGGGGIATTSSRSLDLHGGVTLVFCRRPVTAACRQRDAQVEKRHVVLGSSTLNYASDHEDRVGKGWATAHPSTLANGGDPGSFAIDIRWSHWGGRQAIGYGLAFLSSPGGGYYPRRGTIELRASNIGRCTPGGPLAYRSLQGREPNKPGGPLGQWFAWTDYRSICSKTLNPI
jgi:hypothetical protein